MGGPLTTILACFYYIVEDTTRFLQSLECHSGRVGSGSGPSGPDLVLGWDQNKIPGTDPNSRRVGVGNSRPSRMHRPPA